jgi:hypothetical protein
MNPKASCGISYLSFRNKVHNLKVICDLSLQVELSYELGDTGFEA